MKKPSLAVMIGAPGSAPEPGRDEGEFKAPEGMDMEDKKPGDMIEAVVELEIKDGGMLCVHKVNGMEVAGYDDKEKPADEGEPKDDFADAVMGGPEQPEAA